MSTLHQIREGLHQAWDSLADGWQHFYRSAANAITQFTPSAETDLADKQELSERSSGWGVMASEVFDDNDKIVVRIEVPGLEKENLNIEIRDNYLVIGGEKHLEREKTVGRYHVTECAYGQFERAIPLSEEVEADNAQASYTNGVLRVELPKSTRSKHRKVEVTVK